MICIATNILQLEENNFVCLTAMLLTKIQADLVLFFDSVFKMVDIAKSTYGLC